MKGEGEAAEGEVSSDETVEEKHLLRREVDERDETAEDFE